MRAIVFDQPGGAEVLTLREVPDPVPGPGELLIRVHATAVNHADLYQRRGHYPPPPGASEILGLEAAGTVAALGPGVTGWAVGQRVMALLAGGGYAELVATPVETVMAIPDTVDWVRAAAFPEVFITAYDNLMTWGRLAPGERVLLHGGGSGIGTAAIQLARELRGATVFVTAGSEDKLARCVALGAAEGINYRTEDFVARVRALTDGHGVDVILDIVGGDYLPRNLQALAVEGRLVIIGTMGGSEAPLDLRQVMGKRLTIAGTTLRARPVDRKGAIIAQMAGDALPALAAGRLMPIVDQVMPLGEAAAAHRRMEASDHFGKLVLEVVPS